MNKEEHTVCCADGDVEVSKARGCGCGTTCCVDGNIEASKEAGCGCA